MTTGASCTTPRGHRAGAFDYAPAMTSDTNVAVIGLGYVGLPLAIAFVEAGLNVEGIDISDSRVSAIAAGRSPIDDVSDGRLQAALASSLGVASQADGHVADADVVFVCVPTPITATKDPDLGPVLTAAAYICEHLRAGQLIVLQSTTFPGTTVGPFREALEGGGMRAGEDFEKVDTLQYRVNSGYSFARTEESWHGVEPVGALRYSLTLNYRLESQKLRRTFKKRVMRQLKRFVQTARGRAS